MEAAELMINNYVQLPCGSIVQVSEISSLDKEDETIMFYPRINDTDSAFLGNIKPIIIDDYWLEKFGFKCQTSIKTSIMGVEYTNKRWIFEDWIMVEKEDQDIDAEYIHFDSNYSEDDSFDVFVNGKYVTCLSYVHELQIFYYIISNKRNFI